MPFERLLNNVRQVQSILPNIVTEAMMEAEAEIIDLNTSQLEEGKLSTGANVYPDYAIPEYAKFKKSRGSKAPPGVPDLKLEGGFYGGFDISKVSEGLLIESKDPKAPKLEFDYGSDIYGLTDNNKTKVVEVILQTVQNKILNGFTR